MCVRIDAIESNATLIEQLPAIWEIPKTTPASIVEKKRADTEKAYGYKGVKDPIALKAKAMENIIFAVDQLTADQKYTITYNRSEFIIKCSFNQEECDLENDFVTYLDPTFGACFTYHSANESRSISSGRAGPNYGLRIEVLVNITEYLPTTEAAGVRLTVHSHDEQPFPDTHGFSAPTGFVSSFGIKLQSITRLPAPYGDCVEDGKDEKFIYTDKAYSTEGCQRSCIQKYLFDNCGCGDPRYPPYKTNRNCPVDDPNKRSCINRQFLNATKQSTSKDCTCKQPCRETVYSVSYSAARWPAVPADLSGCPIGLSPQHCLLYKREQGAMVEVYFEKLNYESLLEREAFGWSNLLSDFGGQLGLWMGVSVISVMEVLIFFCDLIFTFLGIKRHKQKTNKLNNRRASLRNSIRNKTDSNKVNNNVDYDSMLENHDHQH
ncbi:hypothetical protein WR25_13952 [Diploscapter pachys]|uniref:Amiloride-sensitive sodium channel n=1 Tax=Diploscapter pachys TaxID=2018661 RepID=A0A2A2J8P6_9BILA|nr:hypothetical protein WR25_13952 [Diploscapter pachys]